MGYISKVQCCVTVEECISVATKFVQKEVPFINRFLDLLKYEDRAVPRILNQVCFGDTDNIYKHLQHYLITGNDMCDRKPYKNAEDFWKWDQKEVGQYRIFH